MAKGQSYQFQLLSGKSVPEKRSVIATTNSDYTMLDNGLVAVRLPKTGEVSFDPPLAMGTNHESMIAAYGQQESKGIAPGPIQGIRLEDGRWVGGSYFYAAKPESAPKVMGFTCQITEEGPLFMEAAIRYTFSEGGFYEFTARMFADDPAIRIDEQFDMGSPGSMWDYRVMVSLANG